LQIGVDNRRDVVDALASALAEGYVYELVGKQAADALRAQLRRGDFDSVTDSEALAARLTQMLQRDTKDVHLSVVYVGGGRPRPDAPIRPSVMPPMFARADVLPGDIGYVEIRHFGGATFEIDTAMKNVNGTAALVVDLRSSLGGEPDIVQYLSTYLFREKTHLLSTAIRGQAPIERWTLERVAGQRLAHVPVYVLTSGRTFSAAESFAFSLRAAGRAILVGEKTRGGGHLTMPRALPGGFLVMLPIGRAYDPRTGTGWEATGVQPDIEVPATQALETALGLVRGKSDRDVGQTVR
jgi:retinol-binding protein 3